MVARIIWYSRQFTNILRKLVILTVFQNGNLKGLSDEITKPPDNSLAPTVKYTGKRMYVKFN